MRDPLDKLLRDDEYEPLGTVRFGHLGGSYYGELEIWRKPKAFRLRLRAIAFEESSIGPRVKAGYSGFPSEIFRQKTFWTQTSEADAIAKVLYEFENSIFTP